MKNERSANIFNRP